jgi:sodium/proline symporter
MFKPVLRKNAGEKEMLWVGRFVVFAISMVAVIVASNPNSGTIMGLVENAWGVFGAAFGPVILLSLFWKRFTYGGAIAGIVAGALSDILWLVFFSGTNLYEIVPGFIIGLIVAVVVTLIGKEPDAEVKELFDRSVILED